MSEKRCENCAFCEIEGYNVRLLCRRYPYPETLHVAPEDWCGEFQPRMEQEGDG